MKKYFLCIPIFYPIVSSCKSVEDSSEPEPSNSFATVKIDNLNWETVKVLVRVRWGTIDWIMIENVNDIIMDVPNATRHKNHKRYTFKDLDHWSTIHPDYNSSFNFELGTWNDHISQQVPDWAWEIISE